MAAEALDEVASGSGPETWRAKKLARLLEPPPPLTPPPLVPKPPTPTSSRLLSRISSAQHSILTFTASASPPHGQTATHTSSRKDGTPKHVQLVESKYSTWSRNPFSFLTLSAAGYHMDTIVGKATSHWSWIRDLDELSRSMREKIVFWGFREGAIVFPPSYRWKRGGDPGDYTDAAYLQSSAYTTSVDEPNLPDESSGPSLTAAESSSFHNLERESSLEADQSRPLGGGGKASSKRTPSYTDRILSHSLPGRSDRLGWRHYDIADAVRLSDHRPVVALLDMQVCLIIC